MLDQETADLLDSDSDALHDGLPHEIYGLPSTASAEFPDLVAAISVDDAERVRELVSANPFLLKQRLTPGSSLPLTLAAKDCSIASLGALLEAGADVAADHHAALFRAASGECPEAVRLLIRDGADVRAVLPGYGTVLMAACECHALESARLLLAHGADPNRRSDGKPARANPFLATPLGMALGSEQRSEQLPELVGALIEAGAKFEDTPVMDLHRGDLERLRMRLDEDPALGRADFPLACGNTPLDGGTLLHVAADYGYLDAAELLLRHGAEVNARIGPEGTTPLFHATTLPGTEMAKLLLKHGADPDARATLEWEGTRQPFTPLEWARVRGASRAMTRLLSRYIGR